MDDFFKIFENGQVDEFLFSAIILVCIILGLGMFIVSLIRTVISKKNYKTGWMDDYYPLPRKITIEQKEEKESGFHVKLNYQILIERITRKLYFLFLLIVSFATGFIFVLYETSLTEPIAPNDEALKQYKVMMNDLIDVEKGIINLHYKEIKDIAELADRTTTKDSLNKKISPIYGSRLWIPELLKEHVKYEDQMFADASNGFFKIYYIRYVVVRIFVATVMFALLTYFIRLYYRLREDRNDFIRKEEALSTYLSVIDSIEQYHLRPDKKPKARFTLLKNKMPNFPLKELFQSSSSRKEKKEPDGLMLSVMSTMEKLVEQQLSILSRMQKMFEDNFNKQSKNGKGSSKKENNMTDLSEEKEA